MQTTRLRWPVLLALACGALLLGAGVLLFVSSHWEELSPTGRMAVVLLLVAGFHASALFARGHFESLAATLHALGTIALGGSIYLTGQIFHLDTGWSGGAMLWAVGAAIGWIFLRQWPQAALLAILGPLWLTAVWDALSPADGHIAGAGWSMLAFTYISARIETGTPTRRALVWIGSLVVIPAVIFTCLSSNQDPPFAWVAIVIAVAVSLGLAVALRERASFYNAGAIVWVLVLLAIDARPDSLVALAWFALGSIGLAAWGIVERRAERVNLGVAAFAGVVLLFYFSSLMDKFGRSASLLGLGVLFLAGGYGLERLRRRLIGTIAESNK